MAARLAALKVALPLLFVVTVVKPRKVSPSALPEGSRPWFAKNSIRKVVSATLASVPLTLVPPEEVLPPVSTGVAWLSLALLAAVQKDA